MYVRLSLIALLIAPAPAVLASVDAAGPLSPFHRLDQNRNGFVTSGEAAADEQFAARFGEFDRNGDGRVSPVEYLAAVQLEQKDGKALRTTFNQLDANYNGYLTPEEASADEQLSANFQTYDQDGDGRLSLGELLVSKEEVSIDRELQQTFNSLDANFDGYVTRQEAEANPEFADEFATWDYDGNGKLGPGEVLFPKAREQVTGLSFKQLDSNFDGFVSRQEAWADYELSENFATHDVNGDAQIGPAEFAAFAGGVPQGSALALLEPLLEQDVNFDGYLSKREVTGSQEFAPRFGSYDSNGDGRIAPQEFIAMAGPQPRAVDQGLLPLMLELDVNRDGYVSRSEAAGEPSVAELFVHYDSNADDRLAPNEVLYPKQREKVSGLSFGQLDVNLDGFVSKREAWADYDLSLTFDRHDRDGNRRLGPMEFAAIAGDDSAASLALLNPMLELDRNRDGYLSQAESGAAPEFADKFAEYDRNSDGRIAPQEYLAAAGPARDSGMGGLLPLMSSLDVNRDGYVSRGEVREEPALDGRFGAMDRNGDGRLDAGELGEAEIG